MVTECDIFVLCGFAMSGNLGIYMGSGKTIQRYTSYSPTLSPSSLIGTAAWVHLTRAWPALCTSLRGRCINTSRSAQALPMNHSCHPKQKGVIVWYS